MRDTEFNGQGQSSFSTTQNKEQGKRRLSPGKEILEQPILLASFDFFMVYFLNYLNSDQNKVLATSSCASTVHNVVSV